MTKTTTGTHETCWKCGGAGRLDVFAHVANGVCFACKGEGKLKAGKSVHSSKTMAVGFVVDGIVWEFEPVTASSFVARKGDEVATVILQSFKAGANLRRGTTILRCRVDPEVARKVYRAARDGMKPEEMTNEFLGGFVNGYGEPIGDEFQTGSCALTRNGRGVSPIL